MKMRLLLAIVCIGTLNLAQAQDANAIVHKMVAQVQGAKTSQTLMEMNITAGTHKQQISMNVITQSPNKMYMSRTSPDKMIGNGITVCDGKNFFDYNSVRNTYSKRPAPKTMGVLTGGPGQGGMNAILTQKGVTYKVVKQTSWQGHPVYQIAADLTKAKLGNGAPVDPSKLNTLLFIGKTDNKLYGMTISIDMGATKYIMSTNIKSMKLNVPVDQKKFKFTPPAGAKLAAMPTPGKRPMTPKKK